MSNKGNEGKNIDRLMAERQERLKELACINRTTNILKEGKGIRETLQQIALILPQAWQYPEFTTARVTFDGEEFKSPDFRSSPWLQKQDFETIDGEEGSIEIYYQKDFPDIYEGPFLKEERDLIDNLASLIKGYLDGERGKAILTTKPPQPTEKKPEDEAGKELHNKQLLRRFLNKNNYDRDVYHDLMPFKVKEILLVANLYDAYIIEKEGRFSEHVLGEYSQLNLTSLPRITGVSSNQEAFNELESKHFDLVIIMMGADKKNPIELSKKIKKAYPYIQVFLLLNNNSDIALFENRKKPLSTIDRIFVWNGESQVFFAMIKHVEDKINVENDTNIGLVRVILLVEDSAKYYSRYLPMLYSIVLEQTKRIIEDVSTDDLYKVLKLRARPKILLASSYEEALDIYEKYKDYLLCLISDVKFKRNGTLNSAAGFDLVKQIRNEIKDLPTIIQSSDQANANHAYELKSTFINKNSETLNQDFKSFITHYLGFGNFVYRDMMGRQLVVAKSLREFEEHLKTIPDESILYHAKKDHFSLWLMARGEIQAAKILNHKKVSDFSSPESIRQYMISIIQKFRNEQNKGKVIPFEESAILDETNIVSLSEGSYGGKGRGLSFINTLIHNFDFQHQLSDINIRAPKTSIIGTQEFEYFLDRNKLHNIVLGDYTYDEIKQEFLKAKLTDTLIKRLKVILKLIKKPLAIRSSGLFEDSLMQPFAGIFETYLLPNNHPSMEVRLKQAMDAIKLVYASAYSPVAKDYIKAVNYKIEEEKMAVIIQEVVGNQYEHVYYPHISGVAQSYNYYPFAHMKPEEGFAVMAVGLGKFVVEGERAYRFSPKYPSTNINSPKDQFKNSQVDFYAVDLNKKNANPLDGDTAGLTRLDIYKSEEHGTLKHCASVYDPDNNMIYPGINKSGPRIVNFANILNYNYIPLAQTIEAVLEIVQEAMGCPVEIEFAVDLNKDSDYKASFYLLQIKPLLGSAQDYNIDMNKINKDQILLYSENGMGNGMIRNITDVIYVDIDKFDKSKTVEMAEEIERLNAKMGDAGKKYILIGPGRWGTRDRWIGIPVNWTQISNAKVIVETSLEDYPLEASSGSHFFHNVTSMNVGYFTVYQEYSNNFIKWEVLKNQELVEETKFFKHVRFNQPVKVRMDGKKQIQVITWENGEDNDNDSG